ncbi:MAG: alpha/beta hydrolase [Clostridiales bacterium]|nr:alpha/beta hydrolase [Clostridiales bacterium]
MDRIDPQRFKEFKEIRDRQWEKMWDEIISEGIRVCYLWEGEAPGWNPEATGSQPRIALYPVKDKNRGTVIICAGGAFIFKSFNEAKPVAEYFHKAGLNAAILDYRVQPHPQEICCRDGLRAIRFLRANAGIFGIPADKIAIGGFSAGGMLSAYTATRFDYGDPESDDPVERVSSRPDAALILYGAMSPASFGTGGLGYDIKKQNEIAQLDNVKNLRHDCPPFFIFQTHEDDPRSAMNFGKELADRGIPFEVHTFAKGPHGGGLYNGKDDTPDFPHTARWAELAVEWLVELGF